jgi:hypothetical protein
MNTSWMDSALCNGMPLHYFFDGYLESEEVAINVKSICDACKVRVPCQNYGVRTKSTGVWGGRWLQNGKIIKDKELVIDEYFS